MKIETWPLDKIRPYEGNPRVNSDEATEALAGSLTQFGWRQPIVVDDNGEILAGEGRWLAASWVHGEGLSIPDWPDTSKAPVFVAHDATEADKRAYRLLDNKLADLRPWDDDRLRIELDGLDGLDFDLSAFEIATDAFDPIIFQPAGIDDQGRLDRIKPVTCPNCGHEFENRS